MCVSIFMNEEYLYYSIVYFNALHGQIILSTTLDKTGARKHLFSAPETKNRPTSEDLKLPEPFTKRGLGLHDGTPTAVSCSKEQDFFSPIQLTHCTYPWLIWVVKERSLQPE